MSNRDEGGHRVAMLSPCFWPEVQRGGERIIRDLADGLIARGHRPMLITSHPGRRSRAVEDGLPIVRNPRPPMGPLVRRGYEDYLTHVPLSYLELTAAGPDLAHAWFPTDATAAVRWAAKTGRPAVFTNLGIPDHGYLVSRRGRARRMAEVARRSDAVVAVSHAAADAFQRWLGVEAAVIHPGVDLSTFTPGGERAEVPTIVCMASADVARKRVPLLLEAFKAVRRSRPDARLRLGAPARTKVSGEGD